MATTTSSNSDPQVIKAQNNYQANEANIKQLSKDLVALNSQYADAVAEWRKQSSNVAGTILTPYVTITKAKRAKDDADRIRTNISAKTAQLNSAIDQREVLKKAVADAQANAIQSTIANAQSDPEIVKARTELEALQSASKTKLIIYIVLGVIVLALAAGYFYLKYKNKV